jgi:Domain of unknown function (DUF4386)
LDLSAADKMRWVKMSSRTADTSQRRAAVIAGLAYVAIIVLALFANFVVLDRTTVSDDAAATASNLASSASLFRSGVAAFVIVLIGDVVVAWALYLLFQPTSRQLSLFAAWFRLVYVAVAAGALFNLLTAARLVDTASYTSLIDANQRNAEVMLSLDAYHDGWRISLVSFGVHLLLLGLVMVKSHHAPAILGRLVALAGLGYTTCDLAMVLLPGNDDLLFVLLAVLAVPGEFGLVGWLLWKGGKGPANGRRERLTAGMGSPAPPKKVAAAE